jgi:NADH-quinone oxidoreductase subunit G
MMATIYVDNVPHQVADGDNLLHAALSLGFNLPYFCWHPAMHSVGACRQCAVKQFRDEKDTRGRIVMACMTPVADGMRVSIDDPEARAFRAGNIEWLMLNHPHDCPVCDEGGECHLQDMTLMTGHNYRRTRFKKRTHRNQYLGPFVYHEMNRCIQCYRCVRFYRDYAGGRDFNVFSVHDWVYFGRQEDGALGSEFSGNLVEVCPTGVFTDKAFARHYTRKWDLETAPSVCVNCSVGCNTIPGARYRELRRIVNRFNGEVNGYFLCDRGRYGHEFVNSDRRILRPIYRPRPSMPAPPTSPVPPEMDKQLLVDLLGMLMRGGAKPIGIGSPRASLEANFALRTLVGADRFYSGMSVTDHRLVSLALDLLRRGPARTPSLEELRNSDAVLVLGEDVTNVAPTMALALRQTARQQPMKAAMRTVRIPPWDDSAVREAIQQGHGPFFTATVCATNLDQLATRTYYAAPPDLARLGFAVAAAIRGQTAQPGSLSPEVQALAETIAEALVAAEKPVIVSGTGLGNESILNAAAAVAWALCDAGKPATLSLVVPECNSLGLAMMGGHPLSGAFEAVMSGQADTVIVLENDLYRRADAATVDAFLAKAAQVVALDFLANGTSDKAGIVLPVSTFAESDGTFVSQEGRAQRFYQVLVTKDPLQESWRWARDVMIAAGRSGPAAWQGLDQVTAAMINELPDLRDASEIAPPATFRIAGMKIARDSHRYSGRTAMNADIDVSEPAPPDDPDSALSFTMEGYYGEMPPSLIPRFWAPGWNSWAQSVTKFQQEAGGPLRGGDPGKRMIEPVSGAERPPIGEVPDPFERRAGEWLAVPIYHIFGSEELSILSPGVAELTPRPYLALNVLDAEALALSEGSEVELPLGGVSRRLHVRLIQSLPPGVAGLPFGLPDMLGVELPAWIKLGNE